MGLGKHIASELPNRLVVRDSALTLDGGTIHLTVTDESGGEHGITLVTANPTGLSMRVNGRLYFDGRLVPMRSEHEAHIIKLLSEAEVQAPPLPPIRDGRRMAFVGEDIEAFFEQTPEENCRAFVRKIVESVQSENYLNFATDEEKAIVAESNRDDWESRSGKKKRRAWQRRPRRSR